ncbi:TetR/AcrR family transcriptional regulator [Flavivirga algicola]|uniref:TetR/AcrR family transcriptional regulator n=1 Tax=Flavivirga algicola TaxID=2729136 RepID=A0ABX1S115_9FLAO|nr:TetR/AcrR family transcriptional regulator [Flavivirga algicola]NMH89046.1 TetR/AcrR family transcriptional regulator [Flavivirga algicola]
MKKHDKESVIKVGQNLFKTIGYYNTGTEEILKQSDYPRSSFYYNFKSKEKFAEHVLEYYGNNSVKFYRSILEDQKVKSPMKRFELFSILMADMASKNEFKSECLIQKFSVECAGNNENLRDMTQKQLNKLLLVFKTCIDAGKNAGEVRTDLESIEMAKFLHAQLYGGFLLSRLQNNISILKNNMAYALDFMRV